MEVKTEVAAGRGDGGGGNQSGGMETLSKVNEQKDNVLAPNTTLSLSETLARGIREGGECRHSEVHKRVGPCFCWWRGRLGGLFWFFKMGTHSKEDQNTCEYPNIPIQILYPMHHFTFRDEHL